jgi:hypothetical protein
MSRLASAEKAISDTLGRYSRLLGCFAFTATLIKPLTPRVPGSKRLLQASVIGLNRKSSGALTLRFCMINIRFYSRLVQSLAKQHTFIEVCYTLSRMMVITTYENALAVYSDQTRTHPHSVR